MFVMRRGNYSKLRKEEQHYDLTAAVVIDCDCALGEGLFVSKGLVSWVDIGNNELYVYENGVLRSFSLTIKATVILERLSNSLVLAYEAGIGAVDIYSGKFSVIRDWANEFKAKTHRTNDGCRLCGGDYLVGTMHNSSPFENYGSVYRISGAGELIELDDEIYIPNSFIELDDGSVLISDSKLGIVYKYEFSNSTKSLRRCIWYQAEKGVAPDGGCKLPNGDIAIAMWDAECVRVFDQNGSPVRELKLNVKRPTNCKFDPENLILWVTSANEGLNTEDMKRYPNSGKTIGIPLSKGKGC